MEMPKIEGLSDDQVLTLTRARSFEQYVTMIQDYLVGKCLFCQPLAPVNVVFYQVDGWWAWENPFPAKNTVLHVVLAPLRHVPPTEFPSPEDFLAMGKITQHVKRRYTDILQGGGFLMRFGSPKLNAGTILHLHANIMVPDLKGEVRLPLAKEPADIERGVRRLWAFENMRSGVAKSDLSDEERTLLE